MSKIIDPTDPYENTPSDTNRKLRAVWKSLRHIAGSQVASTWDPSDFRRCWYPEIKDYQVGEVERAADRFCMTYALKRFPRPMDLKPHLWRQRDLRTAVNTGSQVAQNDENVVNTDQIFNVSDHLANLRLDLARQSAQEAHKGEDVQSH